MKSVLIPTDFSDESLDVLRDYIVSFPDEDMSVLFFSGIKLSDSITDLLLLSRRTKEVELIPESFKNFCNCIQDEFDSVLKVRFEYFYGHTMALFRNFLEANSVDLIVYNPAIALKKINKSSLNVIEIIEKAKCQKWVAKSVTALVNESESEMNNETLTSTEALA